MVSLILWVIAPIFNAIMDLLENENYYQSIFSKYNPKFWYKRESWNHTPDILSYSLDAWHIAKSIMIVLLAVSAVMAGIEGPIIKFYSMYFNIFIEVGLRGILWNVTFSLFYHKIFRLKHAQN